MNSRKIIIYSLLVLFTIGVLSRFSSNPMQLLLPLLIIGGVFFLYKYPIHSLKKSKLRVKSRRPKLRVIHGCKQERGRSAMSDPDEEEPPRYH